MSVLDVFKKHKQKKAGVEPEKVSAPIPTYDQEELFVTDVGTPSALDNQNMGTTTGGAAQPSVSDSGSSSSTAQTTPVVATPSWINAGSYEAAAKQDPNISRGQYAYELGKYRREQGQPDLSYAEWSQILKGQDPYETEAERLKREKNMRIAKNINAIGTFINALVNYNRVKNGRVGYTPDKGTDTYNRLERIRMGQEQLAQSRAKDYLGAMAQDRAERAKAEAAAAAAQKAERDYQFKVKELEWKMENARTEAERKKAADDLAAAKFAYQKQQDEIKNKLEAKKADTAAAQGWARINNSKAGSVATSAPASDGSVWVRSKPLSKEEAMQLVMGSDLGKDKDFLDSFRATSTTTGEDGETIRKGDVNWFEAVSRLMADKMISAESLSNMGYKTQMAAPKAKQVEGFKGNPTAKTVGGFGNTK